ncbi:unnamed protein product [Auanema sp. JU1783]|nr:unnamed protein product [Auanema sp. JU1783]
MSPKIAIIGAGIAGLSAAKRLTELGFSDYQVFEGSDRIGGRIHPIPYHGGYLQMGAQFINGTDNPIYEIAQRVGVLSDPVSDTAHFDEAEFLVGNQPVDPKDIELFKKFVEPLDGRYREFSANYTIMGIAYTFHDLFMEDYERFLIENNINGRRKDVFDALTRSYRSYWEFEWAADWKNLSLSVLKHWNDGGPTCESFTTNEIGYKAILDDIMSSIPQNVFHFNTTVKTIDYADDKIVLTTKEGEYPQKFDHVIVTCSLGHLKRFHRILFNPVLPAYKQEAIEKIGFGESSKIFFRWEKPFWKPDTFSLAPLPVRGLARKHISPFEREITTLQVVSWEPNTLMAWVAGEGNAIIDQMETEEIKEKITKLIRDMMNDQSIDPPSEIVRTQLTKNDLLCGSYSYLSRAQAEAGFTTEYLARPISSNGRSKILFAGEATHDRLFQTAIGAYLSGIREAERIKKENAIKSHL